MRSTTTRALAAFVLSAAVAVTGALPASADAGTHPASAATGLPVTLPADDDDPPVAASATIDVYTTPGYHTVNGRQWRTVCGQYSSVITRCTTHILASTVVGSPGSYRVVRGWAFNNLTYLPAPRSAWSGNPLGATGTFTSGGRQWRTECDTATTGIGACRSYILATVVSAVPRSGGGYRFVTQRTWTFNSMVRFTDKTPPAALCSGAPIPAGFAVTGGRPHAIKTPYTPNTLYNPTSISNFIRAALRDSRSTRSQQLCLATFGANALIAGSTTQTTESGATARWFPYMFAFSANPSVPALEPGWISGLAQGGVLGALVELGDVTGDEQWTSYAAEAFESYTVPIADGGFVNRDSDLLWFEEYPTTPPTTVLNGHLEAVIALDLWQRRSHDPRAVALFQEAIADIPTVLEREHLPVAQGLMSSYDMMRGWPAAQVRVASGSSLVVHSAAVLDGESRTPLSLRTDPPARDGANVMVNSGFDTWSSGLPTGWRMQVGHARNLSASGSALTITTTGTGWQAVSQTVPATRLVGGTSYRLSWRGKVAVPDGVAGTSGRATAMAYCSTGAVSLGDSLITRGRTFSQFDMLLKPVPAGCSIRVTLYEASSAIAGTRVSFDDVTLRPAQSLGSGVVPTYPLSVLRSPLAQIELTYTGTGELQAYQEGRWHRIGSLPSSSAPTTVTLTVPERFTGRNIHYGYHETHIAELVSLYRRTGVEVFLDTARAWAPLAPSQGGIFANLGLDVYEPPVDPGTAPPDEVAPELEEQDAERVAPLEGPSVDSTVPDIGVTPQAVPPAP